MESNVRERLEFTTKYKKMIDSDSQSDDTDDEKDSLPKTTVGGPQYERVHFIARRNPWYPLQHADTNNRKKLTRTKVLISCGLTFSLFIVVLFLTILMQGLKEYDTAMTPAAPEVIGSNWRKVISDILADQTKMGSIITEVYPSTYIGCDENNNEPGNAKFSLHVHSSQPDAWKGLRIAKSCENSTIVECLKLSGSFSLQDLQHLLTQVPNLMSLQLMNATLVEAPISSDPTIISLRMLTALTVVSPGSDEKMFTHLLGTMRMPFLSEMVLGDVFLTDAKAKVISKISSVSPHLVSLSLINVTLSCSFDPCCHLSNLSVNFLSHANFLFAQPGKPIYSNFLGMLVNQKKQLSHLQTLQTNVYPITMQFLNNSIFPVFAHLYDCFKMDLTTDNTKLLLAQILQGWNCSRSNPDKNIKSKFAELGLSRGNIFKISLSFCKLSPSRWNISVTVSKTSFDANIYTFQINNCNTIPSSCTANELSSNSKSNVLYNCNM